MQEKHLSICSGSLSTAEIIRYDDGGWTIKTEINGDSEDIWLRRLGSLIEVVDRGEK